MKAWIIQSDQPVEGVFLKRTIQSEAGAGAPSLTGLWDNKILQWTINSSGETRAQMEHHQDMMTYHGGTKIFWFDGGVNGEVREPKFLGYGDGVRTDYFLPYRFVYAPSLIVSVNFALVTAWTLTESTGMLRFSSPPALNSLIHTNEFKCRMKAFFVVDSDKLYSMKDNLKSYESNEMVIREFPY